MSCQKRKIKRYNGIALVAAMIFIVMFSALAVGFLGLASANTQISSNHHKANTVMNAALSGLDCALYIAKRAGTNNPLKTSSGATSYTDADAMLTKICTELQTVRLGNMSVPSVMNFTDAGGSGKKIETMSINSGNNSTFRIKFYLYNNSTTIKLECTGSDGTIARKVAMGLNVKKDSTILNYAIAGRGRQWVTGDTTIHGDIYSSWNVASISPFNMTADSDVLGTINTVLSKQTVMQQSYQMETLDANGDPMFDQNGNRIYSAQDEVQGYHEGINYGCPNQDNLPGLKISDYNTAVYKNAIPTTTLSGTSSYIANGKLGTTGITKVTEYFPHKAGNYSQAASTGSLQVSRYKYENKTLRNVLVPSNSNALFKNCTFEEVLYIDCATTTSTNFNNIRFENCTFNGVIVSNVPNSLNWQKNCLYFTGSATFQNNSSIPEATILAPHFNVNLGNTTPNNNYANVLTGVIVGGIVDVRGNADIRGTIISMCDTSQWPSGYVTNIGATLNDGGSETTDPGDVGVIEIDPKRNPNNSLPNGITTPVILDPDGGSYSECI